MNEINNSHKLNITQKNALLTGLEQQGKWKDEILLELGNFLEISSKSKERASISIGSFLHWVKPAVLHNQYVFIKNQGDIDYSGYVMWAWVDDDTLNQYMKADRFVIHPMNWNEGENLIIVDFLYNDSSRRNSIIKSLYRKARYQIKSNVKDIYICIRDSNGLVVRTNKRCIYGR
ncbi:toxin-activating lysine-acyltransferase [Aliivibrio fischeri]|uniref:toxin-activating lysine-acyltransferase n=1 Tax=Aliivibrio fischeri TaxID=668 RepID=UPI00080DD349|nr:toxin-activating lysine-acyltransferase [Aliivibrio fischeri]OCH41110.1 hypothetical protein A6E02_15995 [Aliivibrio fischeri]